MAQDTDVARVAAALRAPAIRYKSFGNEAVRTPAAPASPDSYSLLGAAMDAAADTAQRAGTAPPGLVRTGSAAMGRSASAGNLVRPAGGGAFALDIA